MKIKIAKKNFVNNSRYKYSVEGVYQCSQFAINKVEKADTIYGIVTVRSNEGGYIRVELMHPKGTSVTLYKNHIIYERPVVYIKVKYEDIEDKDDVNYGYVALYDIDKFQHLKPNDIEFVSEKDQSGYILYRC